MNEHVKRMFAAEEALRDAALDYSDWLAHYHTTHGPARRKARKDLDAAVVRLREAAHAFDRACQILVPSIDEAPDAR